MWRQLAWTDRTHTMRLSHSNSQLIPLRASSGRCAPWIYHPRCRIPWPCAHPPCNKTVPRKQSVSLARMRGVCGLLGVLIIALVKAHLHLFFHCCRPIGKSALPSLLCLIHSSADTLLLIGTGLQTHSIVLKRVTSLSA